MESQRGQSSGPGQSCRDDGRARKRADALRENLRKRKALQQMRHHQDDHAHSNDETKTPDAGTQAKDIQE